MPEETSTSGEIGTLQNGVGNVVAPPSSQIYYFPLQMIVVAKLKTFTGGQIINLGEG